MAAILGIPDQPSTSSSVVTVGDDGYGTASTTAPLIDADPFVEAPINFVPGLEAHPDRSLSDEPVGSGPFGF